MSLIEASCLECSQEDKINNPTNTTLKLQGMQISQRKKKEAWSQRKKKEAWSDQKFERAKKERPHLWLHWHILETKILQLMEDKTPHFSFFFFLFSVKCAIEGLIECMHAWIAWMPSFIYLIWYDEPNSVSPLPFFNQNLIVHISLDKIAKPHKNPCHGISQNLKNCIKINKNDQFQW